MIPGNEVHKELKVSMTTSIFCKGGSSANGIGLDFRCIEGGDVGWGSSRAEG